MSLVEKRALIVSEVEYPASPTDENSALDKL